MTRICIIGDSSVSAIKRGWSLVESDYPQCELTYFACLGQDMATLKVVGGRLISTNQFCANRIRETSNGLDGIADEYDWFLLVALGFNPNFCFQLCESHRVECEDADERVPISNACFESMVEDEFRYSVAISTVRKLRQITLAPIAVTPAPMRCRNLDSMSALREMLSAGAERKIKDMTDGVAIRLADECGFRLFLQPEHTLSSPLITNSIYSRHPGKPQGHVNAAYGKEFWNTFLDKWPAGIL